MQKLVGIVRLEDEMQQALEGLKVLNDRASRSTVTGNIDFNPGWHTALDLRNLFTVSEAITRSAIERKESRGGQFREDYPDKDPEFAKFNVSVKEVNGEMQISHVPIPEMPAELKQVIEEMG